MTAYGSKKILTTLALLASLTSAGSAFAHAHLKSETPAADTTVSAPKELRLVFSEGVEAQFTQVKISTGTRTWRSRALPTLRAIRRP